MNGSMADDLPSLSDNLSPALRARLERETLTDLADLLNSRGVRTLLVLQSLDPGEKADLMMQAFKIYEVYRQFPANLTGRFSNLFVDVPTTIGLASTNRGVLGLPSSGSGSNSQAVVQRAVAKWPGLVQAMPAGQEVPPGLVPPVPSQPSLPQPSANDTKLMRSLPEVLLAAREIIGCRRFEEAIRCLVQSNMMGITSYLWGMEALAALCVPKSEMKGREEKECVKAAKKAMRDVVLWRMLGYCGGLDSKEALGACVTTAFATTVGCDENTISQISNGFRRVKEEVSGVGKGTQRTESPGKDARSDTRVRGRAPEPREAGPHEAGPVAGSDPTPAVANAAAPRQHNGCGAHPDPRQHCSLCVAITNTRDAAVAAIQPQAEPEPVVHRRRAMMPQTVVVGGVVGRSVSLPPQREPVQRPIGSAVVARALNCIPEEGCETTAWPQQCGVSSFPHHSTGAVCSTGADSQGGRWHHGHNDSSVFDDETQAQGLQLHNVDEGLAEALANTSLEELNKGNDDRCCRCAELLGQLCPYSRAKRFEPLTVSVVDGLADAARRFQGEEDALRRVLRALARVAGPTFPLLALFKTAGTETDDDEMLVLVFAETWSWQLRVILQLQDCQATYFSSHSRGKEQLQEVVDLMVGLGDRCQTFGVKKAVVRHCCMAFSRLTWIAKVSSRLAEIITTWLVATTEEFVAYQDVVHQSLGALGEFCKQHEELLGIDVSRGSSGIQGTLSQHLQDRAMSLACTCRSRNDIDIHTVKQAYRLLVHTHSAKAVMSFVLGSPGRPLNVMLWTVLDRISEMFYPLIAEWRRNNASIGLIDEGEDLEWAGAILGQLAKQGGLAFRELSFPGPDLASSKSCLFEEWVQTTWGSVQDRLLVLGILFGPKALLPQLRPKSGDEALLSAACRALLDLNSLAPFEMSLRREIAGSLVSVSTPRTSSSCLAWVEALQLALQGLATVGFPNEGTFSRFAGGLDHTIFQTASDKLIETIRWAEGWEGLRPFVQEALGALSVIYTNQDFAGASGSNAELLCELAQSMKAKFNDEVQTHKQTDELLSKLECSTETHHR
jgi:hypothetical protein